MNRSLKIMTITAVFTAGIFMGCSGGGGGAAACTDFAGTVAAKQYAVDKQDLSERIVFLGDSITHEWDVNAVTLGVVNFAIGGEATPQLSGRIENFNFTHTARAVVIAIGTNDIYRGYSVAASELAIRKVLDNISVPVVLAGIHPIDESKRTYTNAQIDQSNALWEAVCSEYANCTFAPSPFTAPLEAQYSVGDGLHLNPLAYSLWAHAIRDGLVAAGVAL